MFSEIFFQIRKIEIKKLVSNREIFTTKFMTNKPVFSLAWLYLLFKGTCDSDLDFMSFSILFLNKTLQL